MYADDKPKDVAWYADGGEFAARLTRLERKESDNDLAIAALKRRVWVLEERDVWNDPKRPKSADVLRTVSERLTALQLEDRIKALEERAIPLDTGVRLTNLEWIALNDTSRRLQALESEMAYLRPRRNEDPKTISASHPDAGDSDWLGVEKASPKIVGATEAFRPEHTTPYTLEYVQGHRKTICRASDLTHAQGIAYAYAPQVRVPISCRDADGKLIFEVGPDDEEGA